MQKLNTTLIFQHYKIIPPAHLLAFLLLLCVVLGSCSADNQNNTETAMTDHLNERQTIMSLEREWSDMYGEGDVEGIAGLLAGETVLLVPDHPPCCWATQRAGFNA